MRGRIFSYIGVIVILLLLTIGIGYKYSVFNEIASLGTFITAVITLLTLSEIWKQRVDSFKPEIFLFDKKVMAVRNSNDGFANFISLRDNAKLDLIHLKLINVGLGPAKKIQYKWKFDFDKQKKIIKKYDKEGCYSIDDSGLFLDNDLFNEWPVVLRNKEYDVNLPISYTMILSRAIDVFLTQNCKPSILPSIKLKITFLDVYNNQSPKVYGGISSDNFGEWNYNREVYFAIDEIIK
jgi:hypothetical protein